MSLSAESAVQEELQLYLNDKGVNSLFVKIVEQLLMAKPESPIAFIVQYLLDNFPEETKDFVKKQDMDKRIEQAVSEAVAASATPESFHRNGGDDDDSCSSSDEDSGEDEVEELPALPQRPGKTGRRISVSAGVLNPATFQAVKFDKTDEEKASLRAIVKANVLCSHLPDDEIDTVVDAFEKIHMESGQDVITQGDREATHYFLVANGTVHVYINDDKLDIEYGQGDGFGELALLYNAPRQATCRCNTDCDLWRLDQHTFRHILVGAAIRKRERYDTFLQKVPILADMSEHERMVLADALKESVFHSGDVIVSEGEKGDEFYIISEGVVKVEREGKFVSNLTEGQYFGEIALLTSKNRQATIIADGDKVRVLTVHRKVFQRVLGPLADILSRNMESYSKYI